MPDMAASISSISASVSMICWLFAQLPQIVTNYKAQSVQGLAPTFLASWMMGDATNLLGCVLTDQLMFQTYLATYFCCIDVILIVQYIHYSRINPGPELPEEPKHSSNRFLRRHLQRTSSSDMTSADHLRQSAISATHSRNASRARPTASRSQPDLARRPYKPLKSRSMSRPATSIGPAMHESVQSLVSTRSQVSDNSPEMASSTLTLPRGRSRLHPRSNQANNSSSRERQATEESSTNRNRSIIFLGLFAFFGFGSQLQSSASSSSSSSPSSFATSTTTARAWAVTLPSHIESDLYQHPNDPPIPLSSTATTHLELLNLPVLPLMEAAGHTPEEIQRLIGRVFAWLCAALYLTSRMPQVWKNYRRQSVEGLSILLFFAAFCGNLTYTTSILTNPLAQTDPMFLIDALPYLIGSGGTLIFDLTIMTQSLIYRNRSPRVSSHQNLQHSSRKRTRSRSRVHSNTVDEEAATLLSQSETEDEGDRGRESDTKHLHGPSKRWDRSPSISGPIEVDDEISTLCPGNERPRSLGRSLGHSTGTEVGTIPEEPRSLPKFV